MCTGDTQTDPCSQSPCRPMFEPRKQSPFHKYILARKACRAAMAEDERREHPTEIINTLECLRLNLNADTKALSFAIKAGA